MNKEKTIHLSQISNKELDRDYNEVFNYPDNAMILMIHITKIITILENILILISQLLIKFKLILVKINYLNYLVLRDVDKILLYSISEKDVKII